MNPTPKGWPRISASVSYDDAAAAIDWLCRVFGFEVRLRVDGEDGAVHHSELTYGEGMVMVGSARKGAAHPEATHRVSPRAVGGKNTQNLLVFVDDVDAHHAHAAAAGAIIAMPPTTHDYGEAYWADRTYEAIDLEGHHWWFTQRVRG